MQYLSAACTDVGIKKDTNQDSLTIKIANTLIGNIAMVVVCDGMGGLEQGEVASADVIKEFSAWFYNRLPLLLMGGIPQDTVIRSEWNNIIQRKKKKIADYGKKHGISLGTTAVVGLFTDSRYYILNVGDSRAYEIQNQAYVMTEDQTLVASEVRKGIITEEQAKIDPRRSVLLQCIGASPTVTPDMYFGDVKKDAVYMFCSDGFRHVISEQELVSFLGPQVSVREDIMEKNGYTLIEMNKQRNETDNISVAFIRTY